jgi:hypothetical protein
MGVMGVAPDEPGILSAVPPRACGGNVDCKELVAGSNAIPTGRGRRRAVASSSRHPFDDDERELSFPHPTLDEAVLRATGRPEEREKPLR